MAITPLFVSSMVVLKNKLRLTNVKEAGDHLVDEAVQAVRTHFYRQLGISVVNTLLGYGFTENPTTTQGIMRALANTTEVDWVRMLILRSMPTFTIEGGSGGQAVWNDEAAFRRTMEMERADEIRRLDAQITDALSFLRGGLTLGEDAQIHASVIAPDPDTANTYPGSWIF